MCGRLGVGWARPEGPRGAEAGSLAARGAPGSREKAWILCPSGSGQPRAPTPAEERRPPPEDAVWLEMRGYPTPPHSRFTCWSVFLLSSCRRNAAGAEGGGSAGTGR